MIASLAGLIAKVSGPFRRFPTWLVLLVLSMLNIATAEVTDGAVLLEVKAAELRFQTPDRGELRLSGSPARSPRLGQVVSLRHHKGQLLGWRPLPARTVQGRLHSLNVSQRRLSLKPRNGQIQTWTLAAHHVLFKELKTSRLYSLHRGELLVGLVLDDRMVTLFDAPSYLAGELSPEHGPLLAWGRVTKVDGAGLECLDARIGGTRRYQYDSNTKWQLGAIFRSPEDFEGSECLIFGNERANLVVSRRAFPFMLDKLEASP